MKLLKIFFVPFLGCLILVIACHKSGHEGQTTAAINIQGFELIDFSGNLIGWQGTPDSDWLVRPAGLSAAEMSVLNFNTNLSLNNTVPDTVTGVFPLPNPVWNEQQIYCNVKDSNVIKIVYVDSMLRVLRDTAVKVKGTMLVPMLLMNDRAAFPDHSSRRVYFSLSAEGHPDYAVGYGDVRICSQTSTTDCF